MGEIVASEQEQKEFVKLYGAILRVKNILSSFDEFIGQEILSQRDVQDYHSMYIDLYNELRPKSDENKENINDDLVFEMELIKQVEINIDYILELIRQYHDSHLNNKEILVDIDKAVNSSMELRNKKDLIEQFIASLTVDSSVDGDWQEFVKSRKIKELDQIIDDEKLDKKATYTFVENAFRDGYIQSTGTGLSGILPPISRFSADGERSKKRETVLEKLRDFFDRFFGISGGKM